MSVPFASGLSLAIQRQTVVGLTPSKRPISDCDLPSRCNLSALAWSSCEYCLVLGIGERAGS